MHAQERETHLLLATEEVQSSYKRQNEKSVPSNEVRPEVAQRQTRGVEAHSRAVEGPKRATETVGYAGARESETVTKISAT